jgi:glycerol-3-phosphate dehydrogenase
VSTVEHLLGRYGSAITDLLAMIDEDRTLAAPLTGADRYLAAEAVYAVTHEDALDLDDVLARRTRIAIEYPDRGAAVVAEVAGLIAAHLGWDAPTRAAAVTSYLEQTRTELAGCLSGGPVAPGSDRVPVPAVPLDDRRPECPQR